MELIEVELTNWCQLQHHLLHLGPSNVIMGENDAGKSNCIKGLLWAMDFTRGKSAYGSKRSIRGPGADSATVRVKFREGDTLHEIVRSINKSGESTVTMDGEEKSLTDAALVWTDEWHLPHPEQITNLAYLPQQKLDLLIRESAAVREERLGKLKGLQRIKSKANELKKKKDAVRNARELLSAEGIISVGKEAELDDLIPRISEQETKALEATKLLIPTEEKAVMQDALVEAKLQELEAKQDALLQNLPSWVRADWLPQFETALKAGQTPVTAGETIRLIREAVEIEGQNRQLKVKRLQKELFKSKIAAPATAWDKLKAAWDKRQRMAPLLTEKKLPSPIPSQDTLADWEQTASLVALQGLALAAKGAIEASTGTGALPFDDSVETLQLEMNKAGLPVTCPISNEPLTKEQFQAGQKALQKRREVSEKNSTVTRLTTIAKKHPILAKETSPLAIIKAILAAVEQTTEERLQWIRRKNDAAIVRNAIAAATDADREAAEAWPDWPNLSEAAQADVVQRIRTYETVDLELQNAGPERPVKPERFDKPDHEGKPDQEKTLGELEAVTRSILGTRFATSRAQAKEALKQGANAITIRLSNELVNAALAAELNHGCTLMKQQRTKLETEIAQIKTRRAAHDLQAEEEQALEEAIAFLQPGEGPRELIRQDLEDAIDEVNDRLSKMGIDLILACDEDLTIYAGSEKSMEDPDYRREGDMLGVGLGAIAGSCLQAAFLKQHNEAVDHGKIEFLILDEPTAAVDNWKKPGFYQAFTQGEQAVPGIIMVEHGAQADSFFTHKTTISRSSVPNAENDLVA